MAELSLVTSWSRICLDRISSMFRLPVPQPPCPRGYPVLKVRDEGVSELEYGPSEWYMNSNAYSNVYCQGVLLHDVQMARLYTDSKTFVDMKLKYSEDEVISKYEALRRQYGGTPPTDKLQEFVDSNFEQGDELEEWKPTDYTTKPSLVDRVDDPLFKQWVEDLNNVFFTLSRKVKPDVKINQGLYSLLYVPNGFVIPGGRFRELYYWDTYWILNGILLCDMVHTARGIIENLIYLLRNYNLIPNGSRKYYLQRSQPPLLIPMVNQYYKHTKDLDFVRQNIDLLEKEFNFWMANRMVRLKKNNICYKLARYYSPSSGPRPESYREDFLTADRLPTQEEKNEIYISLKSAAESGHDFSTRWFIKNGTNGGNLSNIDAPHIIPVDLNAFLEQNARLLSNFYKLLGDPKKASHYQYRADKLLQAIEAILWQGDKGIWMDYDLVNLKPRDYFYMSNFAPLWTRSYSFPREVVSRLALNYLEESKVDEYIGGVPTSLNASGEQWDFPNAWPPLQAILIQGLDRLETPAGKQAAQHYATKWLRSNYKGYAIFRKMFEKYDVTLLGQTGTGGEYEFQTGFGWTNGVILELLNTYGRKISANGTDNTKDT
ncbi:trehalase-like isoform X1 [Macrosteles quadrilineatus]|uniref:trehalase-like isoform X1 n=1 Tax=Macrosteles quadrilineatus TaxID=74068 RepID=UPI0023E2E751|nr:trehalase-like isoform X1 [Macrosteles quadrilineatus]